MRPKRSHVRLEKAEAFIPEVKQDEPETAALLKVEPLETQSGTGPLRRLRCPGPFWAGQSRPPQSPFLSPGLSFLTSWLVSYVLAIFLGKTWRGGSQPAV
jgi:hypothetical protein